MGALVTAVLVSLSNRKMSARMLIPCRGCRAIRLQSNQEKKRQQAVMKTFRCRAGPAQAVIASDACYAQTIAKQTYRL